MAPGLVARMVVCSALAITAGTSHAERRPVAVIDLSASDPAIRLSDELYNALVDHSELAPLSNPSYIAALRGGFFDEDAQHLNAARQLAQQAEDFLAQLDDANAARAARSGMQELSFVLPTAPQMLGLYADLAFAYGQAQIGLRKPNDASLHFQLAHRLDPMRHPDPTRYPPNIVQAFESAAMKQTIATRLEVKGDGRVWLDGIDLGPAGGTFDTSEGMHLVQLSGPERETRGEQVFIPPTTATTIAPAPATEELKIKRARVVLAHARDAAERASAMKRLATLLGIGDAVLIEGINGQLSVQTWSKTRGFSARIVHDTEKPIELLAPLAPPPKQEPKVKPEPLPIEPPVVVEKRWYQKNWVRASIAGGVIAGIVSAVLIARRNPLLMVDTDIQTKEP